jgi:general stress protein YciG
MARHKLTKQEQSNGGKTGGPARAAKLSARRRQEIARKAIRARWDKAKVSECLSEIGRRGGEKTGRKGLSAMDPERRKEIQRQGVEARLKKQATAKRAKKPGRKGQKKA